jgi:putative transposase
MKKSKFTEQQIVFALHHAETGVKVEEVCRKMGISEATFYNWKKKYGGLGVSELRRLKMLEKENIKLKQILADLSLDKQMLQDVLKKSSSNQPKTISGKSVSQGIQGVSTQGLQSNNDPQISIFQPRKMTLFSEVAFVRLQKLGYAMGSGGYLSY